MRSVENISWRFVLTVLLLGATLAAARLSRDRRPEELARPLDTIAPRMDGWVAVEAPPLASDVLGVLKATSYLSRTYHKGNQEINLFIAFYASQRAGESMHSPRVCLPGNGWEIWQYGRVQVPVDGRQVTINKDYIQKDLRRMLVVYWYQTRSGIVANEYLGKALLVRDALLKGSTAGSVVRLTFSDTPGALEQTMSFASNLIPQIGTCLGGGDHRPF